ncbi:oxidative stress survival, Svf1-like protein, partial [Vararia minispora EC-137]
HKAAPGSDAPESYSIHVNAGADLQVMLDVRRPVGVPGFKAGKGPKGGYSYFGANVKAPEGYVVHHFWPYTLSALGHVVLKGVAREIAGPGMFVHAIQGMRPNLVACQWNFVHFQSPTHGGTSAIKMEFTTTESHGRKGSGSGHAVTNVGSLVVGGKLVTVSAETRWPGENANEGAVVSRAEHLLPKHDPQMGYVQPTELQFKWRAPAAVPGVSGDVRGTLSVDIGTPDA